MKEKQRKIERRLTNEEEIEFFVDNILLLVEKDKSKAVKLIRDTEIALEKDAIDNFGDRKERIDTLNSKDARDHMYRSEYERVKLRENILNSLINETIQTDEVSISIKLWRV
jgi:hypothetical protein